VPDTFFQDKYEITETEQAYRLSFDLPGVLAENLKVEVLTKL